MSIARKKVGDIMDPMGELRYAPVDNQAWDPYIDALMDCHDEAHAERVVDEALRTKDRRTGEERFPTVHELKEIIANTRPLNGLQYRPDPDCSGCGGTGFPLVTRVVDGVEITAAGSKHCSCWEYRSPEYRGQSKMTPEEAREFGKSLDDLVHARLAEIKAKRVRTTPAERAIEAQALEGE